MAERVLTERELNRALLARQLLLERSALSIPRALERLCGIQNQYAPNAYIRLRSCLEDFERDDLDRALARRSVVQGSLMRETIHLVSRRDYPFFAAAIRRSQREWWLRVHKGHTARELAAEGRRLRSRLRGTTISGKELGPHGADHWVELVRIPPSGTWKKRRADTYALAEEWVGPLDVDEREGTEHLVRRYLAAFGPAPTDDVAKFTGIPRGRLGALLDKLPLRRFRDERGTVLHDVPRAPLPHPETPAPVRFLPTWDAALLVHARRTGILSEEHRKHVFDVKMPPSYPTFLVDGRVAGTWRFEADRIRLDPFGRLARAARRELDEEAERLAALHR